MPTIVLPRWTSVISFNLIFKQPYDVSSAITILMMKGLHLGKYNLKVFIINDDTLQQ